MDDVFAYILVVWVALSAMVTINFAVSDYREFDNIAKACQTTGYIQNKTTRIICALEKPIDRN